MVEIRQLRIEPDLDELELGTLMDLESNDLNLMVGALATMVVDGDGEAISVEEGMKYLRGLKLPEIRDIADLVTEAIQDQSPKKKKLELSDQPSDTG